MLESQVSHYSLISQMLPKLALEKLALGQTYAEQFSMVSILFVGVPCPPLLARRPVLMLM
jgi:hypothetical protein